MTLELEKIKLELKINNRYVKRYVLVFLKSGQSNLEDLLVYLMITVFRQVCQQQSPCCLMLP